MRHDHRADRIVVLPSDHRIQARHVVDIDLGQVAGILERNVMIEGIDCPQLRREYYSQAIGGKMTIQHLFQPKVIGILAALLLALVSKSSDAQERCGGTAPQAHDVGGVSFTTTSRVYTGKGVETYETCVENRGDKDLFVDWFVPGPFSYVKPGKAITSPRSFLTRESKDYRGCLEYGSVGDYIKEPFIGHVSDSPRIEAERGGCDEVNPAASQAASTPTIIPVELPIKLYFPSDAKEPEVTMLQLEGVARAGADDNHLFTTLAFSVTQASDAQKGRPEDVRIRPFVSGDFFAKDFVEAFDKQYSKNGMVLSGGNELNISFYDATYDKAFTLASIRYGVFDQADRLVAAFFAPIWGPASQ
jgi:hypothetical protein